MIQQIDYFAIAAPLTLAIVAGLVLLLDAFLPARPRLRTGLGLVTLGGILTALGFVVAQAVRGGRPPATFCVPEALTRGAGAVPPDAELCSFVADRFTLVFAGLVLVAAVVVVLMSMTELAAGGIPVGEWYFLLLCTLVGAVTLPAARDLVMLVVALELVSLPVFALTALKRYDGRGSEAAVKLFVVSVVSTAVMLFGVSLLYGVGGTVFLSRLGSVLGGAEPAPGLVEAGTAAPGLVGGGTGLPAVVTVGVVLVLAGFAFKIAAVPFHSWAPDVYQGAPLPVAALLSVISKAAGFAGLILLLVTALAGQVAAWGPVIAVVAALTMSVGNLLAMRQRSAVRLLAWSSVAQSGYILAPIAVASQFPGNGAAASGTEVPVAGAVGASVAYLVIYAAMNLGAFAVVMLVSRVAVRNELDDYRGLALRSPAAGLALAFCLICLAGLPPGLAGLFAKVVVFRELVSGGAGWLAVVMAVNTVIGLYYYAVWTARLFTPGPAVVTRRPYAATWVAVGLAVVVAVAFSLAPQLVFDLTALSAPR
ncbi:NADH-quinone oxidoreductase subunit N [Nonomuraea sp. NPDC047897]|uniref:NADH-quinone oxidoreductase subunit N n=1 Tax=Nonomuraea sp. NPDC047897 TaxID=3364346 RepID=UPI0037150784